MRFGRTALFAIAVVISVAAPQLARQVLADVVTLKDGTKVEGDVKKTAGGWTVVTADGKTIEIRAEQVKRIEVGPATSGHATTAPGTGGADQAMSNLMSLRRSVENVNDLGQIVERFKRFIDQYKGTPAEADARQDLELWQHRLDQGLVKLGSRWVRPDERTALASQALVVVDQAKPLVEQGRLHDADELVRRALDLDPQCAPALYLRGLILYQQNQVPAARKAFEAVTSQLGDHAPTLNNLAVVLWRQNAQIPALSQYDRAMTATPGNRYILDNVAEAIAALPDDQRKNQVAQRTFRRFTEQDARLQEVMAAEGLYRWGSAWLDKAAMEQLRETEKRVNEKLAKLKADGEAAQETIVRNDAQISSIEQSLRRIENDSVYRDADGRLVRVPYPSAYYELQNDLRRLQSDRASAASKLLALREDYRRAQAEMPQPKFTGVQRLVGAEGAPVMVLADPTTAPGR